ncbi:MAG: hypothetical protein HN995_13560 [Candidatus Marinimicrobia bacterium]|jgi:hypothetical protein|nr:hypothetical protein [Candidatus Neomarinimicrobiota bacterium]MBT3952158.1 hypothetical protein [Candidatus Neomarinimicrobiota bacterium]MBT6555538.1 hypothetical protein [Candidatus Neomarinimicrobiota bacterium]MBT6948202.1 hypothetical protein [Candidatus Neomarinimicrobiota bacterium]MBT7091508.1 hypothetical protein [Candidatus Neomarinimicrobiota bacterium]
MRKGFSLALSVGFLLTGILVLVTVGSVASLYIGAIYLFLGGMFMKNSLYPKESMNDWGVFKAEVLVTDPFRAAVTYFLVYYGVFSLLKDISLIGGLGEREVGLFFLVSLLMVLFTYMDQLKKSKLKKKTDA